jgi:flagellar basal-body rod protein FlgC
VDPLFGAMAVSATGLTAERFRLAVIANNLANVDTPSFRRQSVVLAERAPGIGPGAALAALGGAADSSWLGGAGGGVEVVGIVEDPVGSPRVYDPGNPLADAQGYVTRSNVSPALEMVDLLEAANAYRANATALQDAKEMVAASIAIGR